MRCLRIILVIAAANALIASNVQAQLLSGSAPVIAAYQTGSSMPSLSNGQTAGLQNESDGSLRVSLVSPTQSNTKAGITNYSAFVVGTGQYNRASAFPLGTSSFLYNGSTQDAAVSSVGAALNGNSGVGVTAVEEAGRNYMHISASQSATNIKASKGFLHTVNINTCVSNATVSLYDTATTTTTAPIAVITCPAATNGMPTQVYNIAFTNGLALAASAATDVTVSWR